MLSDPLGLMVQVAEAGAPFESISVVPKKPFAVAVLVAVKAFIVTLAVNVAEAPAARVVAERVVSLVAVEEPGSVSSTSTLLSVPTPLFVTDPIQL
jgi:hypothetical protein